MAFQKVNIPKKFHPNKGLKKGDTVEGTYIRQGKDKFGGVTHEFRDSEEDVVHVLNSSGHLNYLMDEYADYGDYCRITYLGKTKLPKTSKFAGTDSHNFEIEIDRERSVRTVAAAPTEEPVLSHVDADPALESMTL
jgi:hypothetical protein